MILAGALLMGVFAACTPAQQQPTPGANGARTPDGNIERGLTIAVNAETPSITPARHTAAIGHWKNNLTHNGLFRWTYDMEIVPDLVESWRPITDTIIEFTLREGIMFHNGDIMTAYDAVASWHYVRNYPEGSASHASAVSAEVVSRYVFTIDTGTPNALLFPDLAFQANFKFPQSLIEAGHDFTLDPVGTGPFVFEEWNFGDSLTFSRFDNYFDQDRQPSVSYVHWRVIPEGASRTIALEMGEVDLVAHVAVPDLPRMRENPNITVAEFPGITLRWIIPNHEVFPFGNRYIRHALEMALDKEAMVLAGYDGFAVAQWEQFPTALAGSSSENIRRFDPDGARALFAQEGIDPTTISFEMLTFTEEMRRQAEVAQANFADLGITTTIAMVDFATWGTITAAGDHEFSFANFTQSSLLAFLRGTMHTSQIGIGNNRSRFYSPEFSELIDQAIATIDDDLRLAMIYELTAYANYNCTWIPVNVNIQVRAFDSRLRAPELAPGGGMNINMMFWAE